MFDSFSLRWLMKRLLLIICSRLNILFIASATLLFIASYSLGRLEETLIAVFHTCNSSNTPLWKEIFVHGQIRTAITSLNLKKSRKVRPKLILLWTTYFSEEYSKDFYFFRKGTQTFDKYNCEFRDCEITSNKSLLPESDAVVFHARDLKGIPKRTRTDQIWILHSMEPPQYAAILKWRLIQSRFNWTMTYRSDSQVQVKYGTIVGNNDTCRGETPNADLTNKKNAAIWMVSNCRTQSKREAYVRELRKHFPVDIYGKCSRRNRCEPPQSEACYKLLSNYKFYLSFENSICKDYVTEKFFNAMLQDTVPVVLGGADYSSLAPEGSLVDAGQFPSPEDLARHLWAISSNTSWYESFYDWKKHYSVHLHLWMCDLCQRLHDLNRTADKGLPKNLWAWWVPGAKCRVWSKRKGFRSIF